MITIKREVMPTQDENGVTISAGVITLSNYVDVWFGDAFAIKTAEEAKLMAETILTALNKNEYSGYDLIGDNKVYLNSGYNGEFEHPVAINDIYDFIVESGMNEYYISEVEMRRLPVDKVLNDNPDIYKAYYTQIVLPKLLSNA